MKKMIFLFILGLTISTQTKAEDDSAPESRDGQVFEIQSRISQTLAMPEQAPRDVYPDENADAAIDSFSIKSSMVTVPEGNYVPQDDINE